MKNIIISIGSNLGDRKKFLEKSIYLLSKRLKLIDLSSIYETKGFGVDDHPDYLNRVIFFKTNIFFFCKTKLILISENTLLKYLLFFKLWSNK